MPHSLEFLDQFAATAVGQFILGQPPGQGIQEANLLMAAFVICSDSKAQPRHESALLLTEAIINQLGSFLESRRDRVSQWQRY